MNDAFKRIQLLKQNSKLNLFENSNNQQIFLPPAMEEDILHKVSLNKKTMNSE